MKSSVALLTIATLCLCACETASNTTRTAVGATGSLAQKAATGTIGTAAAAGRTGAGVVSNTTGGAYHTVRSTARGDVRDAGRAAVNTATTTTSGAIHGTAETGRRAGATGINTATNAGRAAGDTVRAGAQ